MIQPDHECVIQALERLHVLRGDHATISHKDYATEPETLLQVADILLHDIATGGGIYRASNVLGFKSLDSPFSPAKWGAANFAQSGTEQWTVPAGPK
jgi:hypothetical protein